MNMLGFADWDLGFGEIVIDMDDVLMKKSYLILIIKLLIAAVHA